MSECQFYPHLIHTDAEIAQLNQPQLQSMENSTRERDAIITDLRHQLQVEKTKEPGEATPTPADFIPDLDPWYADSLERYIVMLRAEAGQTQVKEQIQTFRAFMQAESAIRESSIIKWPCDNLDGTSKHRRHTKRVRFQEEYDAQHRHLGKLPRELRDMVYHYPWTCTPLIVGPSQ
jgi:hypothetical protein